MTRVAEVSLADRALAAGVSDDEDRLRSIARERFDASMSAADRFFQANLDAVSSVALDMAHRFRRGGRLLVFGEGADATDAQHVSVEFVHPVIVGKRALPAVALTRDLAPASAASEAVFATTLRTLGRPADIALGIGTNRSPAVGNALGAAESVGMLTISIESDHPPVSPTATARHRFVVPGSDLMVAQEVAETLYHVMWELVHLFLEHGVGGPEDNASTRQRLTI